MARTARDERSVAAKRDTPTVHRLNTVTSKAAKVSDNTSSWGHSGAAGFRNCGNSAAKNKMAFGLLPPTISPCR